MRIMLCTPAYGGNLTTDYTGSLINSLNWLAQNKVQAEVYFLKNESLVSRARNNCASHFLRSDCDKLLFIDADQAWHPEDIQRLLSSKRTLVGGTYSKKILPWDLNFTPLPAHDVEFFPGKVRSPEAFLKYATSVASAEGEAEVRHLATGFMLIDRSVLTSLKEGDVPTYLARDNHTAEEHRHWDFFPSGVTQGHYLSEDFFFCSQAKEAGHAPYLNVHVIVDHLGAGFNYSIPQSLHPEARSSGTDVNVIEKSDYDSLAKDHADDWKRIQDAERRCESLQAELDKNRDHAATRSKLVNENASLRAEVERLRIERDEYIGHAEAHAELASLRLERDALKVKLDNQRAFSAADKTEIETRKAWLRERDERVGELIGELACLELMVKRQNKLVSEIYGYLGELMSGQVVGTSEAGAGERVKSFAWKIRR